MTTLTKAHNEWAKRADDERFSSLDALHNAVLNRYSAATTKTVETLKLQAVASADNSRVLIEGANGHAYPASAWAFSQFARLAGAPPGYLATLPANVAADCINHGLKTADIDTDRQSSVLFHRPADATPSIRAMVSTKYGRIWDADITSRLLRIAESGVWQPAPAAFDQSRGLYAGDRDMFAFMVDNNRRIFETLPGGGLSRGFFVWNSEVGARSFGLQTFLYEYVCGNHRVWGASNVKQVTLRHVGSDVNDRAFMTMAAELTEYANGSAADDEARIERMRTFELGGTKDEILDRLFGLRLPVLGKGRIREAIALAEQRETWYGNPRTVWALAGAVTEIARDLPCADDRVALDAAGAKIMALAG